MRNRADCVDMAETADESPVEQLDYTSVRLHRGMRGLIQQSAHLAGAAQGR